MHNLVSRFLAIEVCLQLRSTSRACPQAESVTKPEGHSAVHLRLLQIYITTWQKQKLLKRVGVLA